MQGDTARGRPEKHEQILQAATEAFLDAGYGACSMDLIAQKADVAKQTIYHHFGSKDALFQEIVRRMTDALLAPLSAPMHEAMPAREALTTLAHDLVTVALEPTSLGLYRLLIAEGPRQARLGTAAYDAGAGQAIDALAAYLDERIRAGDIAAGDTRAAAAHFFGMVIWHAQLRALLGVEMALPPREIGDHVGAAVDAFLAAYGAGPAAPA